MNERNLKILIVLLITGMHTLQAETAAVAGGVVDPQAALNKLLERAKQASDIDSEINRERVDIFLQRRDRQEQLLNEARKNVQEQERLGDQLEGRLKTNDNDITVLEKKLNESLGNFGELFGFARQIAADTRAQVENSLISAQFPGREQRLNEITANKELPTMDQLRGLWETLLHEQLEQGKITMFRALVNDKQGKPQQRQIIRLGPFTAVSNNKYLVYSDETQQLTELNRQPGAAFIRAAEELENAAPGELVRAAIDPSSGTILGMLIKTPSLNERVHQGGIIGYVVIGLLLIGLVIGLERFLVLWITSVKVKRQARNREPSKKNPLGRVLTTYAENSFVDVETLELKLDDAILKEVPRLERGLSTLKVLAGVAPLLGLLGTVTGMILTFQSITLWGTGDPKIMASGISQALITTVLGLIAAIPLLLIHSLANSRAKLIQQILEEHSAGLIAAQAEKKHA